MRNLKIGYPYFYSDNESLTYLKCHKNRQTIIVYLKKKLL
jgi:hypothetical protein